MAYWDEYEKKKPGIKKVEAARKKKNASNMQQIQEMAAKAREAGMSYGQYVGMLYASGEREKGPNGGRRIK